MGSARVRSDVIEMRKDKDGIWKRDLGLRVRTVAELPYCYVVYDEERYVDDDIWAYLAARLFFRGKQK